jgi:magnesium chelatase family protein
MSRQRNSPCTSLPQESRKEGSGRHLAIANGILVAEDVIPSRNVHGRVGVGERSRDGPIKSIPGAKSIGSACRPAHSLLVPAENSQKAAVAQGVTVYPLPEAVGFLTGTGSRDPPHADQERVLPLAGWRMTTMAR